MLASVLLFLNPKISDSAGASSSASTPSQDGPASSGGPDGLRHRGNPANTLGLNPAPPGVMQRSSRNDIIQEIITVDVFVIQTLNFKVFSLLRPEGIPLPMQGGAPAGFPVHPMYMPMQMFWWQQMYARHYYVQ